MVVTGEIADPVRVAELSEVADVVQAAVLDGAAIVEALGDVKVVLC